MIRGAAKGGAGKKHILSVRARLMLVKHLSVLVFAT